MAESSHRAPGRGLRKAAHCAVTVSLALAASATPSPAGKPSGSWGHAFLHATVAGIEAPNAGDARIAVEQATGEIDAAVVTVFGEAGLRFATGVRVGDDVDVESREGSSRGVLFRGEVVGVEPVFESGEPSATAVRALNRLHRLTRGKKTRIFQDVTDADVVRIVAEENGLLAAPSPDLVERHDAVYQHEQTDLEFLLERASRLDYEVLVEDTTLLFRRAVAADPIALAVRRPDGEVRLQEFRPRLSSSNTVQKVTVRGWNPIKKEAVVGSASARTVLLVPGADVPSGVFGGSVEIDVDEPLFSVAEAEALARAELLRRNPISAEAACVGDSALRAGLTVVVAGADRRFDGKYYVVGVKHTFCPPPCDGGYRTLLRLRRLDGALFRIPEIDDEVLVVFAHGDLGSPVVVGSLWD